MDTLNHSGVASHAGQLAAWLGAHAPVLAITGAGVSTASGIPDYRDRDGEWKRQAPIQHRDFVDHTSTRRRYWARSYLGWPHFADTQPNAAHRALAELERLGLVGGIITQNVDRLHQRAGSTHVIDLHGRLDRIECLDCGTVTTRDHLQERLKAANPDWHARLKRIAPDGDADIEDADYAAFQVPDCEVCGGTLKPSVVFYGGAVPQATRERAMQAALEADAVLVVGSSLMVWSAFRLVRAADEQGTPIAAINQGRTRADDLLEFKWEETSGQALDAVVNRLRRRAY
jgi:NAD-dependent SIR2 family protein deacetylase